MNLVAFFDIETNAETGKILDIGCIRSDEARFHKNSIPEFQNLLMTASLYVVTISYNMT
jgi:hypothetical protein